MPAPQLGIAKSDQSLVLSGVPLCVRGLNTALKSRGKRHVEILDGSIHPGRLSNCFEATSSGTGVGRLLPVTSPCTKILPESPPFGTIDGGRRSKADMAYMARLSRLRYELTFFRLTLGQLIQVGRLSGGKR